jgi:hypothetical protein
VARCLADAHATFGRIRPRTSNPITELFCRSIGFEAIGQQDVARAPALSPVIEDAAKWCLRAGAIDDRPALGVEHASLMEVVCSRCRRILASGAGLGGEAVLNGSVRGCPGCPWGCSLKSGRGQGEERGRAMSGVEQAPAHSVLVRPDSVAGRHVRRKRRPIRRSDVRRARILVPGSRPVTFRDIEAEPVHEICS